MTGSELGLPEKKCCLSYGWIFQYPTLFGSSNARLGGNTQFPCHVKRLTKRLPKRTQRSIEPPPPPALGRRRRRTQARPPPANPTTVERKRCVGDTKMLAPGRNSSWRILLPGPKKKLKRISHGTCFASVRGSAVSPISRRASTFCLAEVRRILRANRSTRNNQ